MKLVDVIISTEVVIATSGIMLGFVYLIRGSGWKALPTVARILSAIFLITLACATAYTHSLLDAATRETVPAKKIEILSDAIRLNPNASTYTRRAEAHTAAGERQKALKDVERAIAIAPNDTQTDVLKRAILIGRPKFKITDLGTLGGNRSLAYGINSWGHVTGFSELSGEPSAGFHAFIYDDKMRDLGALNDSLQNSPHSMSSGVNINDNNEVVGNTWSTTGGSTPFVWDSIRGMRSLNLPGTYGNAINNKGQVLIVASVMLPAQHDPAFLLDQIKGRKDLIAPLASVQGCFPNGRYLNDSGVVVGYCESATTPATIRAFVWDAVRGTRDLEAPATIQSIASAVNNKGEITGSIAVSVGVGRAVRWNNNSMEMLPLIEDTQGNILNTDGYSINELGNTVGMGSHLSEGNRSVNQNAVLWVGSAGYVLDSLIPDNSGWHLSEARAINNAGQIAGYGVINGHTHAFRLDLVPAQ